MKLIYNIMKWWDDFRNMGRDLVFCGFASNEGGNKQNTNHI